MSTFAKNLGKHFASRDPQHIARWVNAQLAGRARAPKCEAVSRTTGVKCCRVVLRGGRFCFAHARGEHAVNADRELAERNHFILFETRSTGKQRRKAALSMRRIARAEVYRQWKLDPRFPEVDLLQLSETDETRVADWLWRHHQIRLSENLPGTERPPTARARDRLRYAAWRVIARGDAVDPDFVKRAGYRVINALRDDAKFWFRFDNPDAPRAKRGRKAKAKTDDASS